nr:RNA-directed DNA polymerase, eukaryota, reverse transcriptase zinc-binding domain protein [Tanacetum cinerariifolium]
PASKKNDGLGILSFHALNRALLLKWVWRFLSQDGSLWYHVIQALYGASFELHPVNQSSIWGSILREMQVLISKGLNFVSHCKKRVGDGHNTRFWYDSWVFDQPLRVRFPRLFTLETDKESTVASKLGSSSVDASFRRSVRDGVERQQWDDLNSVSGSVTLSASKDRWIGDLNGDGVFRVKEVRTILDDILLPSAAAATRLVKYIPIKIHVLLGVLGLIVFRLENIHDTLDSCNLKPRMVLTQDDRAHSKPSHCSYGPDLRCDHVPHLVVVQGLGSNYKSSGLEFHSTMILVLHLQSNGLYGLLFGQRITWDLGIRVIKILKQHLEDKVDERKKTFGEGMATTKSFEDGLMEVEEKLEEILRVLEVLHKRVNSSLCGLIKTTKKRIVSKNLLRKIQVKQRVVQSLAKKMKQIP